MNRNEVLTHDGKVYTVSPWAMCWDDEKYYLVAFDDNHFKAKVNVAVSNIFLGWFIALEKVKIVGPDDVVERMKEQIKQQYDQYYIRNQ